MSGRPERPNFAALGRAIRYLVRYRGLAALAYLSLLLSVVAQLMVPQLVQWIVDAVTGAAGAGAAAAAAAETAILLSGLLIVIFAFGRGLFAFSQAYMSERVSQSVAFDIRNELYAKIQRLSFSYHDRAQTGQLMIRATDDVEKVRTFIGQGLLIALQALLTVVATLVVLAFTSLSLTLVVLPILPLALGSFMLFGSRAQPMFV